MEEAGLQHRPAGETQIVRFGTFELCLRTGELRKQGVRVRLQGKPFHILKALLEEPGRVVTRDELKKRLWAADTFVDFESGLNTAANRLRGALGDSAENPIYIETLARVGYRFIAPVIVAAPDRVLSLAVHAAAGVAVHSSLAANSTGSLAAPPHPTPLFPDNRSPSYAPRSIAFSAAAAVLLLLTAGLWRYGHPSPAEPSFRQITFNKGSVAQARFTFDGASIVFSAEWTGQPSRVFLSDTVNPDAHSLGYDDVWLASVSQTSGIALFDQPKGRNHMVLEQVSLRGGNLRTLSERALGADWGPSGVLSTVTRKDSIYSVEFPAGKSVFSTNGWISDLRVSPLGNAVAFLEHPVLDDDAGRVVVVDSARHAHILSDGWGSASGLAWSPSGKEVWFTAARSGTDRALMAVDLHARLREIARTPGGFLLQDVARSGKVLIARTNQRMSMSLGRIDQQSLEDISRFDWSHAAAITLDGQTVLFDESGQGGGKAYSVYLYRVPNHTFKRIGDGRAVNMSADGQWVLSQDLNQTSTLNLIAADGSSQKTVSGQGLNYQWAGFLPGHDEILFVGTYPGKTPNLYRQHLPDGAPVLVHANAPIGRIVLDRAGRTAVAFDGSFNLKIFDLATGGAREVCPKSAVLPLAFLDAGHILVRRKERGYIVLESLDVNTGNLTPFHKLEDPGSNEHFVPIYMANDLNTFVYSKMQSQSDLFVVTGWS